MLERAPPDKGLASGPSRPEKSPAAICRKVAPAADGDTIEVWGDGHQTRSYCYIEDCELVDMIAAIAGNRIGKRHDLAKPQGLGAAGDARGGAGVHLPVDRGAGGGGGPIECASLGGPRPRPPIPTPGVPQAALRA